MTQDDAHIYCTLDQMQGEMKATVDTGDIVGVVKVSRQKK
jgi:threonyl-tRNA synthetase